MQSIIAPNNPLITISLISDFAKQYQIKSEEPFLGETDFSTIYKGVKISNGIEVAIKISNFTKNPSFTQKEGHFICDAIAGLICTETIKANPHKNIVSNLFAGIDIETKQLYEVMEYCNSKSIKKWKFSSSECLNVCYQTANGLSHLHSHNIIHKDLRVNNIFVHKSHNGEQIYKLANFNMSYLGKNLKTSKLEYNYFKAPEIFKPNDRCTNKVDIWSLGVTLYWLLFHEFPFDGINEEAVKNQILEKKFEYPKKKAIELKLHPLIENLLEGMLDKNPEKRPTAAEVMQKIDEINETVIEVILKTNSIKSIVYNTLGTPMKLSGIGMKSAICFGGRGMVPLKNSNNEEYFALNSDGNVQKIRPSNSIVKVRAHYDVGAKNNLCSIVINDSERNLLVGGCSNKNIYLTDTTDLKILNIWKQTHNAGLWKLTFLDNEHFCAGYWDGTIKKFSISSCKEVSSFKIDHDQIESFWIEKESNELLVGDSKGMLYSISWHTFNSLNWRAKIHKYSIHTIIKSGTLFVTGSFDQSIALLSPSTPPQVLTKIQANDYVYQLLLTPSNRNMVALCENKILLFENKSGKLNQVSEKSIQADFNSNAKNLSSFFLLNNNTIILGDCDGEMYSIKLQ